jgi:hypothetical protein
MFGQWTFGQQTFLDICSKDIWKTDNLLTDIW